MLDLSFRPDRVAPEPLHEQLAEHLRELIASGRLRAGEKVPATRELARDLGIARNTAAQAYRTLVDDGALLAHVGQGTFVASRGDALATAPGEAPAAQPFAWGSLFSRAARTPLPSGFVTSALVPELRFDFRCGRVDPAALPVAALRRAYGRAIARDLAEVANLAHPYGYPRLREQIARSLLGRGIDCRAEDVLVTAGAQQALDLLARVLLDPGDRVAVEAPGYPLAAMAFRSAGAEVVGIGVDDAGLRTDQLARTLRTHPLKAVYVTPAAQLPTGVVLSDARRRALLELADETQTPIIEDDYDSEFRFGDAAPPALKTRDHAGQVVYVGTFSKAVFPGLRLGYAVAAPALRDRLAVAQLQSSFGTDGISQAAMAELLASGAFERHVRRLRRHYADRRAALLESLAAELPTDAHWFRPRGGLQVFVTLPGSVSGPQLREAALARGIAWSSGESFHLDGRGADQLALSFANLEPAALRQGVAEIGELVRELVDPPVGGRRSRGGRDA